MGSPLTDHVRDLTESRDADRSWPLFWNVFRAAVRAKLRQRGLLSTTPRYLGFIGYSDWRERNPAYGLDAFHELCNECYEFAVLDRLPALYARLRENPNIDGLIRRNIEHFLLDRQSKYDRIGYAVFRNAEAAVEILIESGRIIPSGLRKGRIRNETELSFSSPAVSNSPAATETILAALRSMSGWDKLLGRLAHRNFAAQKKLASLLDHLPGAGVGRLAFADLLLAVKSDVRQHAARTAPTPESAIGLNCSMDGHSDRGPSVGPETALDDQEEWQRMVDCMASQISEIKQKRVRLRVEEIFRKLVKSASMDSEDREFSQAAMARSLGVAATTLNDSYKVLRQIAGKCRRNESG